MATDIKKLAEELTKLTVLEVNELKNVLKDEYGIEPAAAAVAVAGPAAGADAGAAAADEIDPVRVRRIGGFLSLVQQYVQQLLLCLRNDLFHKIRCPCDTSLCTLNFICWHYL